MPPKRSSDGASKSRKRRKMPPRDTEEYKEKRDRNNEAVKKSREKSREQAKHTVDKVTQLRSENDELEQQVTILSKELVVLKDLFKMVHAGSSDGQCRINGAEASVQTDPTTPVNMDAVEKDHEYSASCKS